MPVPYGSTGAQQFTSAPAVGQKGATYFNTTDNTMYQSNGSAWVAVSVVGHTHAFTPLGATDGMSFTFNNTTTDADPGVGFFRLNNATQNASVQAFVDLTSLEGANADGWMKSWDDLGSADYGVLTMVNAATRNSWLQFKVSAIVAGIGYNKITFSLLASNPNNPFNNGDTVWWFFDRFPRYPIAIEDHTLAFMSDVRAIDFQGSGVVLTTGVAGETIVTISGSGGAAGGDLSGTYPNPTVLKASGTNFLSAGPVIVSDYADTVNDLLSIRRTVASVQRSADVEVNTSNSVPSANLAIKDNTGTALAHVAVRDDGQVNVGTGSTIRPVPFATAAGSASVTITAAASGNAAVTFPTGRFTQPPIVVATVSLVSTAYFCIATGATATGCTVSAVHRDGTATTGTVPVSWVAIQMTPTSGSG